MSLEILYASDPPQFSSALSLDGLSRLDARFRHLRELRQRAALALIVQDSADLLGAHLHLSLGRRPLTGTPGALDEDGTPGKRPFHGWSERALDYALGLDLVPADRHETADLPAGLACWNRGVVYAFGPGLHGPAPRLARRLNLANDFDRLELDFLAATGFAVLSLLRAHRLGAGGRHQVLRVTLQAAPRPHRPV